MSYFWQGGADQGMPIIVSRVAPGTPADIAIPRLNEGDQVLFINGRDVSQHTHEQVREMTFACLIFSSFQFICQSVFEI